MRTITTCLLFVLCASMALGEPRNHSSRTNRNYILRRQQAYQVQGVPTSRLIIGRRQIDIYPNGLMFEGDNVVGIRGR